MTHSSPAAATAYAMSLPQCPACGQILMGLSEPRCPECGLRISEADWADLSRLVPRPRWEQRLYIGRLRALFSTLISAGFAPRRFFRGLEGPATLHGAFLYWVWLLPLAWPLAVILLMPAFLADEWKFLRREEIVDMICVVGIRTTALLLSGLAVWLPTLVALDAALWRRREEFHRLARAILYSMAWWFWAAVFFGGIGSWLIPYLWNRSILGGLISSGVKAGWLPEFLFSNLSWGSLPIRGFFTGPWPQKAVPWIAWVAAVLATMQFVMLLRMTRRSVGVSDATTAIWRHTRRIVVCGWLIALYLLLFDRHVQLRFHLILAADEWKGLCNWANALVRGENPFVTGD